MKKTNFITSDESIRKRYFQTCFIKDNSIEEILPNIYKFKEQLLKHKNLKDLFNNKDLRDELIICAGASKKSLDYLNEDDIKELLERLYSKYRYMEFEDVVECILYRYIIQKGDSYAGAIRNKIGFYGKEQIIEKLVDNLEELKITYHWFNPKLSDRWIFSNDNHYSRSTIIKRAQGFAWVVDHKYRLLIFNENIPYLNKNVDIVLLNCTIKDFTYKHFYNKYIMMGEIKSGIDIKNADEHWKTGWASLERIINYYSSSLPDLKISIVLGAVTEEVSQDVEDKMNQKKIDYAVNITDEKELDKYCKWIISL